MKKFILGCTLMLCGAICGTGWLIASVSIVEGGAWSSIFNIFDFRAPECYIILIFYVIAIIGTIIVAKAFKEDK